MKKIKYEINFYDPKGNQLKEGWSNLDSLPRFQAGDYLDHYFFNSLSDLGYRAIVADACYYFLIEEGNPTVTLSLHIREETGTERRERLSKLGVAG
jgi:hypothetical protein